MDAARDFEGWPAAVRGTRLMRKLEHDMRMDEQRELGRGGRCGRDVHANPGADLGRALRL